MRVSAESETDLYDTTTSVYIYYKRYNMFSLVFSLSLSLSLCLFTYIKRILNTFHPSCRRRIIFYSPSIVQNATNRRLYTYVFMYTHTFTYNIPAYCAFSSYKDLPILLFFFPNFIDVSYQRLNIMIPLVMFIARIKLNVDTRP